MTPTPRTLYVHDDLSALLAACRDDAEARRLGDALLSRLRAEPSRIVVSFGKDREDAVKRIAAEHGVPLEILGEVGGSQVRIGSVVDVAVDALHDAHHRCLEPIVGT